MDRDPLAAEPAMTHVGSFYHELSKVSLSTSVCQFCRSNQRLVKEVRDYEFWQAAG